MRVLISTVPDGTSQREIHKFVLGAVCSRFHRLLRRRNRITAIDIIELADDQGAVLEYHAIVEFESTDIGLLAIRKLNGTALNGRPVVVKRYYTRSSYRDRRRQRSEVPVLAIHDRRKGGRRRLNLRQRSVNMANSSQIGESGPLPSLEAARVPLL